MTDYEWLTKMGMCHKCRKEKAAPDKKYCFDCLEKIRETSKMRYDSEAAKKYQKRRRELYQKHKENRICVRCSNPATHGMHCYECSIKVKRQNMKKSEQRKQERHDRGLIPEYRKTNGLCRWCGEPALPGVMYCEKHGEIFSVCGRKGYEQNLINKNNPWINEVELWKKRNKLKDSENT